MHVLLSHLNCCVWSVPQLFVFDVVSEVAVVELEKDVTVVVDDTEEDTVVVLDLKG